MHSTPGGRNQYFDCRLFEDKTYQAKFLEVWDKISRRYAHSRVVWGYDLANEPSGTPTRGPLTWQALALRAAQAIRANDSEHMIIVEPSPWARPEALRDFKPLPVSRLVYSVHVYEPQAFTHQGVFGRPTGVLYPGLVEGEDWNVQRLRATLRPVVEFQLRNRVAIYVGEFSAVRWAPGKSAYTYLRDVIAIFEEHHWSWAYHAFREWTRWNVEHGSRPEDEIPPPKATDRERLLRRWFERDRKWSASGACARGY